jgi:cytochrome c peroxidase
VKGKLSKKAVQGKVVFEKAGCGQCHSGIYYTDGQKYDVGTGIDRHQGDIFDTPTLIEVWRTGPYLYDGRAKTLQEVFTTYNQENMHGNTIGFSEEEISRLIEYVLSL